MDILNDIKKTLSYARRNGIGQAITAARERLSLNRIPYTYEEPAKEIIREQRADFSRLVMEAGEENLPRFSVVVPAYRTPPSFYAQMIESVKRQTYGAWELIIADATPGKSPLEQETMRCANDARIRYMHLQRNLGISGNTNEAVKLATGDYIVLLDHDDLLTPDALYEIARVILSAKEPPVLVYSDEDKFVETDEKEKTPDGRDTDRAIRRYLEPHRKSAFDFEKLLSNNYICHVAAIRADLMRRFPMRSDFDGSQDHDLFLRIACETVFRGDAGVRTPAESAALIAHVPRVLYHWRIHEASTAGNPSTKRYAKDAGSRAVETVMKEYGFEVSVKDLLHLGFYRTTYPAGTFEARPDIGVIGGCLTDKKGVTVSGRMDETGEPFYGGLGKGESGGFQHPAALIQEAEAIDLRCAKVRDECLTLYAQYGDGFDDKSEEEQIQQSLAFCRAVTKAGYRILYDPQMKAEVSHEQTGDGDHSEL